MGLLTAAVDSLRIAKAYLFDVDRRQALRAALERPAAPTRDAGAAAPVSPTRRSPYADLTPFSEALLACGIRELPPSIDLVLPQLVPEAVFAGVKTAVDFAAAVAREAGRPVRLVQLIGGGDREARARRAATVRGWLAARHPEVDWAVLEREDVDAETFGIDDLWIATHWWTAHAVDVAVRTGRLRADSVMYLVQDYEPGFVPWSTDSALAESTYRAGFAHVVNSTPLQSYLEARGVAVDPDLVFAPTFDADELRAAAQRRVQGQSPVVFFYGRPSKPRNQFALGVAALRLAAEELARRGLPVDFVMAGEAGPDVDLGPVSMRNLGVLSHADYFDLLGRVTHGLTLQASPHPSHPPFDLAMSGSWVVVNDVAGGRNGIHPRIRAVEAHPQELADALVAAIVAPHPEVGFLPLAPGNLGRPMPEVAADAWRRWRGEGDR